MRVSKAGLTVGGAVVAALAASACCLGPLLLTVLGIGGAAAAVGLAPYRPYLLALTVVLLGGAFHLTYRRPIRECGPGGSCVAPGAGPAGKALLWIATIVVLLAVTFPYYSVYLF